MPLTRASFDHAPAHVRVALLSFVPLHLQRRGGQVTGTEMLPPEQAEHLGRCQHEKNLGFTKNNFLCVQIWGFSFALVQI